MLYNQRKRQTLELFADHRELRPYEFGALAGFYPLRSTYTYLARLHRMGLLRRRRDFKRRLLYQLSPRGARWLLKRRRGW